MAIQFVTVGTAGTAGSGNVTPDAPATLKQNDILILCGHSRDNVVWSVDNGYASIVTGNAGTLNRIEMWWKRTTGVEGTTTVTHTAGNSISTRIYAYRGCVLFGNPYNTVGTVQTNAGSPISTEAITTTFNDSMILHLYGSQDNNTWSTFTGACTNDRGQATDTSGTDDSMGLADGILGKYGTSGTSAATQSAVGPDAGASVHVALTPEGQFVINNYQHVQAGSGISVTEKIR
jgi:hypothetical protein